MPQKLLWRFPHDGTVNLYKIITSHHQQSGPHAEAPGVDEMVPRGHAKQVPLAARLKVPGLHFLQAPPSRENAPASQGSHLRFAPDALQIRHPGRPRETQLKQFCIIVCWNALVVQTCGTDIVLSCFVHGVLQNTTGSYVHGASKILCYSSIGGCLDTTSKGGQHVF